MVNIIPAVILGIAMLVAALIFFGLSARPVEFTTDLTDG
jgi:hypothetical protein